MEKSKRKSVVRSVATVLAAFVVLVLAGGIGNVLGVFDGVSDITQMIKLDKTVYVKLLVMIAFVTLLCNLLLTFFKLFQLTYDYRGERQHGICERWNYYIDSWVWSRESCGRPCNKDLQPHLMMHITQWS